MLGAPRVRSARDRLGFSLSLLLCEEETSGLFAESVWFQLSLSIKAASKPMLRKIARMSDLEAVVLSVYMNTRLLHGSSFVLTVLLLLGSWSDGTTTSTWLNSVRSCGTKLAKARHCSIEKHGIVNARSLYP